MHVRSQLPTLLGRESGSNIAHFANRRIQKKVVQSEETYPRDPPDTAQHKNTPGRIKQQVEAISRSTRLLSAINIILSTRERRVSRQVRENTSSALFQTRRAVPRVPFAVLCTPKRYLRALIRPNHLV